MLINNIQSDILEHLGRFSYLSVLQLHQLTGKSVGYLRAQLGILKERKYVCSYHVVLTAKIRAENIYYLTIQGRDFLIAHEKSFAQDIKLPIGIPLVVRDYYHRLHFIQLHIALYQSLAPYHISILQFMTYFDKTGNRRKDNNLRAKTQIDLGEHGLYIPDGVMITEQQGRKRIYFIEYFADKNSKRIMQSLTKQARAISIGAGRQFGLAENPFVLCCFEHEGIKKSVMQTIQQTTKFAGVGKFFFFSTLSDIQNHFFTSWHSLHEANPFIYQDIETSI